VKYTLILAKRAELHRAGARSYTGQVTFSAVNTCFEFVACCLAWRNAYAAWREVPRGVYWPSVAFSVVWGVVCIPYYLSHGEVFASVFAGLRDIANACWVYLAVLGCKGDGNRGGQASG
jgi:hypothetical protein